MPRLKRKSRARRPFGPGHLAQLKWGWDYTGTGWGDRSNNWGHGGLVPPQASADVPPEILAEMEHAWAVHGESVLASWDYRLHAGRRPWAWWQFSAPEPRDKSIPEPEQLERLGLLTPLERTVLHLHPKGKTHEHSPNA